MHATKGCIVLVEFPYLPGFPPLFQEHYQYRCFCYCNLRPRTMQAAAWRADKPRHDPKHVAQHGVLVPAQVRRHTHKTLTWHQVTLH